MSETNNKGSKSAGICQPFICNNYLGQRVRCDEKFDGRDHTYIPFGVPVYDRGAWDGGSFLETDPGNVDAGV